jgi:hypothetical protein
MNNKHQNHLRFLSYIFLTTLILLVSVSSSFAQGCDMGNAYSLTEMWVQQEDSYNHESGIIEPIIIANGVVENDYNTCGHEYSTRTVMTLPNNTTVEGAQTDVIIDGIYFASTQLKYYCSIAAREFDAGESFNELELYGDTNDVFFGYSSSSYFTLLLKFCNYRACFGSNQSPSNNCFHLNFYDIVNTNTPCPGGVRATYQRYRVPYIGGSYCVRLSHVDYDVTPCQFGTL